jgi:hypothetical protein
MKARILALILALAMLPCLPLHALASNFYIIPDSNTRRLTEAELWEWQYDALGFIFNEIFARHGFVFDPDGRYYAHFNHQTWYHADPAFSYNSINNLEWDNYHLIKDVRAQMRAYGDFNLSGKSVPNIEPDLLNIPQGFEEYAVSPGQKLSVYAGPGTWYLRGANGKAMVNTNGSVYVYGWDSGWLLVLYRTNNGGSRIGYVDGAQLKGSVYADPVNFSSQAATITRQCAITDDPVGTYAPLATLQIGDQVTFLAWISNSSAWAYVEANTAAGPARGFIPANSLE